MRFSIRSLLILLALLAVAFAVARVTLRVSRARWTPIVFIPLRPAESTEPSAMDRQRSDFEHVFVPWMRERGYVLPGQRHQRTGSYQFHESRAGAIPRGVHVIFNPVIDQSFVEIEVWDYYPRWRWDSAPAIAPTDKDWKATAEIQGWLEAYFADRVNPFPIRHRVDS